jgi:3-dehydroquinate dehydratase II
MPNVLVLHGPNLQALGSREPEVYGHTTLAEIDRRLNELAAQLGCAVECRQSNHEGVLIDALYAAAGKVDGVLLNPGGLTHTSVALRDAIHAVRLPVVEVHLSNPAAREPFRTTSLVSGVAAAVVQGFGADGYLLALRGLLGLLPRSTAHA